MTFSTDIVPAWTTTDGVEIAGRHWEADRSHSREVAVVLAHGFTASSHETHVVALASTLAAAGYEVVSYDARGHGASGGLSTLGDAERFDVAAAYGVAATIAPRVVLVGASMGAVAVLRHAAFAPAVDGVVVLSCPARWRLPRSAGGAAAVALTRTRLGRHLAARQLGVRVAPRWTAPAPPVELVGHVEGALAIVHGERDRFIPPSAARELHAVAPSARLRVVPGLGHGFAPLATEPLVRAIDWTLEN
ncbi:MAG TPA: alpha/beta fold hydrolase [Acidimicrobiia bacterium]|jgi:pimeloyl-ACP methyl ester carboxylesterase|nr:alpha/beta fold hydrolase [Acidimicrobiia bacterium]